VNARARQGGCVTLHPPTASDYVLKRGCRTARRANERDSEDKDAIPEYLGIPVEARNPRHYTDTQKHTVITQHAHVLSSEI
jgi:hypothetical protein